MSYYIKALKNYARFDGRATRSEYWYFFLFNVIISFVLDVVGGLIHVPIIGSLYSLAVLVPGIAVGVRRMHDVDKSGWFLLIPLYNLILAITAGTAGPNAFGADPQSDPQLAA
ncbi:MAG: DUF805 domain-containing protein [Myxococcales bacterium]|nr:DUF805 domain-containing protein [Myxococcales bacterium]